MKRSKRYKKGYNTLLERIGEKLYALRMARNESLQKAAGKMKITPAILSKIEKGQQNFRLTTFFKICRYYRVEPREIAKSAR